MIKKSYLFILLFLPFILQAQNKLPGNMFTRTLPNGLTMLVVEDNSVPLATVMMTFKAGAFTESDKFNGLTGLYQGMLFRGNKDYRNKGDFGYHAGQLGLKLMNSEASQEYAACYFTLPKFNLEEGLNFMNSAIRFPKMDPEELELEKGALNDAFKEKESNQFFALSDAMSHHLWGDLYSRKNAMGTPELISSATAALLDSIKNKYYYPNNAILIVGGDVAHEAVFKMIEKIYGNWKPAGFDPVKKWPAPEFKPLTKSDYFIVRSPISRTPFISVNWQGPDIRNDVSSTYAADVFSYIINQKSSKLNKALIQSGLAFSVTMGYLTLKHVGPISLTVVANPAKVKECMDEVKKQIALMGTDNYISPDQVETAKRMLEIKKIREEEITTDYVHALSFWWASASLDYFAKYNDNLKKVSIADLKNYVTRYIKNKPYCAGLLINPDLEKQVNAESFFTLNP